MESLIGQSDNYSQLSFTPEEGRELELSLLSLPLPLPSRQGDLRIHLFLILDALQEDVDFCEDGETTIARDGAIAIPGGFYITDDGQEAIEENEVPQILLQA